MFASRIAAIAAEAGVRDERVDEPGDATPEATDLVVLEWDARTPAWPAAVATWMADAEEPPSGPRVIAAVSHRDRDGIRAARNAGIEHVVARSALTGLLRTLLDVPQATAATR